MTHTVFPARIHRVKYSVRMALKILTVITALASLLIPTNGVSHLWYPVVMGFPLLWGALRDQDDQEFATWAIYILGFVTFTILRVYADDFGPSARADYAIAIDRLLGLGTLPTLRLQHALYQYGSERALDRFSLAIYLSYFVAPPLFAVALWLRRKPAFRQYVVAMITLMTTCLAIHFLLPTAPPWLAALRGELPHVSRITYDVIYRISSGFYNYGHYVAGGNDVAAMPSLHMGATALIAVVLWQAGGVWRISAGAYALAMGFSLVYLGEHYLIDVLAGAALALGCWYGTGRSRYWAPSPNTYRTSMASLSERR
jgi:membrane-associated phospholipid phosphatase